MRSILEIAIPRPLIELLSDLDFEEGALLLGSQEGNLVVIEGVAFTHCVSTPIAFNCVPLPRDDLIGVFHKHVSASKRDFAIAKLWKAYLVSEGGVVKGYSYGRPVRVRVI
ncbi:hypothetical protein EYM_02070 [Ignicoccus islandicus DSM 13165]|uniref:Uncharacterized protein n=1 Tax=Ignicoccus islandicus DSM 13165 TaxID=940295 RepID=A0A0U3F8D2_9CREN|nr:hypothetical protein [Ignicoccus islandicus]ALU12280.1 hypothetical protein EYM_02070 [Ignicoccus islandicus DSM 13165]